MQENQFKEQIKIPKQVFKFRHFDNDNHIKLLNGQLYFSSPLEFNDPFDCNINIAFHKLQNNVHLQKEYFNQFINRSKPNLSISEKEFEIQKLINEGRFNDPLWLVWQSELIRKNIGNRFGIFCLSKTKSNILLWAHYAKWHQGYCVGFNSEQLFVECSQQKVGGGDVSYVTNYPEISPTEDLIMQCLKQTFTKADSWNYEEEYRLFINDESNIEVAVSINCINEINLGCAISQQNKEAILRYVETNLPNIKVFETKAKKDKFELEFYQIK